MIGRTLPVLVLFAFAAAGCGYKGPLTLPPKSGPVVTRPASATQPTAPATAQPGATQPATAPAQPPATGTDAAGSSGSPTPPKPEGGGE